MSRPSGAALASAYRARRLKVKLVRNALAFVEARAELSGDHPSLDAARVFVDSKRAVVEAARALAPQNGGQLSDAELVRLVGEPAMREVARDLAALERGA